MKWGRRTENKLIKFQKLNKEKVTNSNEDSHYRKILKLLKLEYLKIFVKEPKMIQTMKATIQEEGISNFSAAVRFLFTQVAVSLVKVAEVEVRVEENQ